MQNELAYAKIGNMKTIQAPEGYHYPVYYQYDHHLYLKAGELIKLHSHNPSADH